MLDKAPQKPVLLLSIIQLIPKGAIQSNSIFRTRELVIAFKNNRQNSSKLVALKIPSFLFNHLGSEVFCDWFMLMIKLTLRVKHQIKNYKYHSFTNGLIFIKKM